MPSPESTPASVGGSPKAAEHYYAFNQRPKSYKKTTSLIDSAQKKRNRAFGIPWLTQGDFIVAVTIIGSSGKTIVGHPLGTPACDRFHCHSNNWQKNTVWVDISQFNDEIQSEKPKKSYFIYQKYVEVDFKNHSLILAKRSTKPQSP
jgi:hypothetical protein